MTAYIYFSESENGLIKIGMSIRVIDRVISLAATSPTRLRLVGLKGVTNFTMKKEESTLHERFAIDRVHGEWFRPSEGLSRLIKKLNRENQEAIQAVNHQLNTYYGDDEDAKSIADVEALLPSCPNQKRKPRYPEPVIKPAKPNPKPQPQKTLMGDYMNRARSFI